MSRTHSVATGVTKSSRIRKAADEPMSTSTSSARKSLEIELDAQWASEHSQKCLTSPMWIGICDTRHHCCERGRVAPLEDVQKNRIQFSRMSLSNFQKASLKRHQETFQHGWTY
jgi:hypothetical protein